jgi:hypothetical protein
MEGTTRAEAPDQPAAMRGSYWYPAIFDSVVFDPSQAVTRRGVGWVWLAAPFVGEHTGQGPNPVVQGRRSACRIDNQRQQRHTGRKEMKCTRNTSKHAALQRHNWI